MNTTGIPGIPKIFHFSGIWPCNDIEICLGEGQGHFDGHDRHMKTKNVRLSQMDTREDISVIWFKRVFEKPHQVYSEVIAMGYRPCHPNYLLGWANQTPESNVPDELSDVNLIAADPNQSDFIFPAEDGTNCFIFISRYGKKRRELLYKPVLGRFSEFWGFLVKETPLTKDGP